MSPLRPVGARLGRSAAHALRAGTTTESLDSIALMTPLAGPFLAAAGLLGVAGAAKVLRPAATAGALRAAGLRTSAPGGGMLASPTAGRLVGAAELGVALAALLAGGRVAAALVAGAYLTFAAFTVRLLRTAGAGAPCGCFGADDVGASVEHVWVNAGLALIAAVAAVQGVPGLVSAIDGQPLAGVPFLLVTAVCGWLLFALLTALPDLRAALADGRTPSR